MAEVRVATGGDIGELVRLRAVLFEHLGGSWGPPPDEDGWREACTAVFADLLADETTRILVVDAEVGLAACGIGLTDRRLPSPYNPTGRVGHILGVVTDPAYRKRGHARAVMRELVRWFDERGTGRIDLNASPDGLRLYEELGFKLHPDPTMRRSRH
ncbi:MAG TPA: GNAT family N-acetyltransferase [Kribbellaceae bacterium]|nr:GNAT family N-acetyltransferase [Kribbellaceae bacterium]